MGAELGQNHRCALVTPSLVICNFFVHTIRCVYVVHTQHCLHGPQRTASGSPFFVTLGRELSSSGLLRQALLPDGHLAVPALDILASNHRSG